MRWYRSPRPLLVAVALAASFVACSGQSGGVLQPDVRAGSRVDIVAGDGVAPADGVAPTDSGGTGGRDTVYRDLPPTDWAWPEDAVVDPLNSVAGIQQAELGLTCDPSIPFLNHPDPRTLTGLVVLSPVFEVTPPKDADPGKNGYFAAEAPGAWHGIQLVVPKDLDPGLLPGDVVTAVGEGREFYCLTQFEATAAPTVTGQSGLPPAEDVAPESLRADGTQGEPYEGTLVRLSTVHVREKLSWGFELNEGGVIVQDALGTGVRPAADCQIASLVGVVTYSFEEYKIILLRAEDVEYANAAECATVTSTIDSVVELQQSPASAACDSYAEASGVYPAEGNDMELAGLVVTTPVVYISSNLRGYYLQEPQSAPWTGVLATFFKDDDPLLAMGDVVTVRGDWQEYKCLTQVKVAAPVSANLTKTDAGEVPLAIDIDAARAASDPDYAEQFEGVLVRVTDQVVAQLPDDANHWQLGFASGLVLDDVASFHYEDVVFTVGQTFPGVSGVLFSDTFTQNRYLLAPRNAGDFELPETPATPQ